MSFILSLHITISVLLITSSAMLVLGAVLEKKLQTIPQLQMGSFIATLLSGLALLLQTGAITHVCIMMTVYSVATIGIRFLYRKRTTNIPLVSTN